MRPLKAVIAEDEPVLRAELRETLAKLWPDLVICAEAEDGIEALRALTVHSPDILFLDIQMPGLSGLEVAKQASGKCHVAFVTAYDKYAVQAFAHGVLDYLVKPVEVARLAETVARLQERLRAAQPALNTDELLQQLAASLSRQSSGQMRWVRASVGQTVRMIAIEDIDYLRADEKYTQVAWRDDGGQAREAIIRTPLKELLAQLDPAEFAQVHRSVVVNLRAISHVTRGANETADVHLKGRPEVLPVSRTYLHLFRQM